MLNLQSLCVLASTEVKLALKLFRTQIFLLIAIIICITFYVLVELQYVSRSAESASVGLMAPTYLAGTLGSYFMALFSLAIIILAYDLRERNLRSKIHEVLEVVPASNVTVVMGRLLGLVFLLAVPMLFFVIAITLYGWMAESAGLGYGNLIELHSVASFLVWDLVPNLAFFGSLVIFLSTIARSKIFVLLISFASVLVVFWLLLRLPLDFSGSLVTTTGATLFPSEIAPRFASAEIIINRLSLLLFTAGFVMLAGSCWPRPLANRKRVTIVGVSALILGCLTIGGSLVRQHISQLEVQEWIRAHDSLELSTFPDVTRVSGTVKIVPGRDVELDLTIELVPPEENTRDYIVLSLNPGYHISKLWVGDGESVNYGFDHGILQVPMEFQEGNTVAVRFKARGRPDVRFAYLEAAVKTKDITGVTVRNLFALGTENFIFHPRFVVLTSGIKWYPTSGAATGEDAWEARPRDLFKIDLEVSVPIDWLVAGPGHRELISSSSGEYSTYRIAPKNPVPEITLVGSNFERTSTEVEDIEFEVLFSKHHQRKFQDLSEIERSLKTRISSYLVYLKSAGLVYPHELFSLVEIPTSLRVYGGGWNMDTIMGPPGMVLMRESSLPNSNVSILGELSFDHNADLFELTESQRVTHMNSAGTDLSSYFNSNVFGEHPSIGFARNFVRYQTSTTGKGARVLDHVMEEVVQRLVFDRSIFWGDRIDTNPGRFFTFEVALAHAKRDIYDLFQVKKSYAKKSEEELALMRYNKRSKVWNDLERFSLGELSMEKAPLDSLRVVRAKSTALSRVILDLLGRPLTAKMLTQILGTHKGNPYNYNEMLLAAQAIDLDLEDAMGEWLNARGLPGFILAEPSIKRLPDSDLGKVFEASFVVHNAEPNDGFATVSWIHASLYGGQRERTRTESKAFLVRGKESVRISVRSEWEPTQIKIVYLEPYLSLNRHAIRIDIPDLIDADKIVDERAQPYIVDIAWSPPDSPMVVVDDVDEDFEIVYEYPPRTTIPVISFLRELLGTSIEEEWDQGLLHYSLDSEEPPPHQRWLRRSDFKAFGKYRHTYAFVHHGKLERPSFAKFTATLPRLGRWQLEYHMPFEEISVDGSVARILQIQNEPTDWYERFPTGITDFTIKIGEKQETVEFDASTAEYGWNIIGEFGVDSTHVEVWISGASDKKTIYADAIRWVPLREKRE